MATGSAQEPGDLGHGDATELNRTTQSISSLIASLKFAFRSVDFAGVEATLIAREKKLIHELENKVKENDLLQFDKIEKIKIENELKEIKKECLELREMNRMLREENNSVIERLGTPGKDKQRIFELMRENQELTSQKLRAEYEVQLLRDRFDKLDNRVSFLEKELSLLSDDENRGGIMKSEVEERMVLEVDGGSGCHHSPENRDTDDAIDSGSGGSGNSRGCVEVLHASENMKGCKRDGGSVKNGLREDVCCLRELGNGDCMGGSTSLEEKGVTERCEKGGGDVENEASVACGEKVLSKASGDGVPSCLLRVDGNRNMGISGNARCISEHIVEIGDSDDDSGSLEILDKEITTQVHTDTVNSYQKVDGDGTRVLKRRLSASLNGGGNDIGGSSVNDLNIDNNSLTGTHNTMKRQKLITGAENLTGNHCCVTSISPGMNVAGNDFTPSRHDPGCSPSSDDTSSSCDSGSLDFSSSLPTFFLTEEQGDRDHKEWESEKDMVAAFEKDGELCLRAVCALYRLQTSVRKTPSSSPTFGRRGLEYSDLFRVTNLAEFLIDGDQEGKLKKSVEELVAYNHKGLDDCKKLVSQYSKQLYEIYKQKEDPLFFS